MGCDFRWWGSQPATALQEKAIRFAEGYYQVLAAHDDEDGAPCAPMPQRVHLRRRIVGPVLLLEREVDGRTERILDPYELDVFGLISHGGAGEQDRLGARESLLFDRHRGGRLVGVDTLPPLHDGCELNLPLFRRQEELARRGVNMAVVDGSFTRLGFERWAFALMWVVLDMRYLAELEMQDDFLVYDEVWTHVRELDLEEGLADESLDFLNCWRLFVDTMREHRPQWFADSDEPVENVRPEPLPADSVRLPEPLRELRIDDLELSVRTTVCLQNAGITTLAALLRYPAEALLLTRNFGNKSLRELQGVLAELGLTLPEAPREG